MSGSARLLASPRRPLALALAFVVSFVLLLPLTSTAAAADIRSQDVTSLRHALAPPQPPSMLAARRRAFLSPHVLQGSFTASRGSNWSSAWIPIQLEDSPYQLIVYADASDGHAHLTFQAVREVDGHGTSSWQAHSWAAALPSSDIRFGRNLSSISIDTGTDLGSFGSVDLHMTSLRDRRQHTGVCKKTGKKLWTDTQESALLKGTLDFRAGVSFLPPKIESHSIGASAFSESATGNHCPGHHHGHPSCASTAWLQASDGHGDTLQASDTGGEEFLQVTRTSTVGRVHVVSTAQLMGRRISPMYSHGTIRVMPPKGQQLIEGSLTFLPGDWGSVQQGPHCTKKSHGYDGYGGVLTTGFDSGPLTLHGSAMTGKYVRTRPRR